MHTTVPVGVTAYIYAQMSYSNEIGVGPTATSSNMRYVP